MIRILCVCFLVVATGIGVSRAQAPAAFDQMLAQLQQTPTDAALREQIIKSAASMRPAPQIPEDARRFLARGAAAFEAAKSPADFELAVGEFVKASNVAPWWGDPYFNLGKSYEGAGKPQQALSSYKLYLLASPQAADFSAVQTQVYKLEFLAEQQAKAATAQAQADSAAAQRRSWAAGIVKWLQSNYGGRGISGLSCNSCTEQMAAGNNWYQIVMSTSEFNLPESLMYPHYSVTGPNNDQVKVVPPWGSVQVCGAPYGPNAQDITWTLCPDPNRGAQFTDRGQAMFLTSKSGNPRLYLIGYCTTDGACTRVDFTLSK